MVASADKSRLHQKSVVRISRRSGDGGGGGGGNSCAIIVGSDQQCRSHCVLPQWHTANRRRPCRRFFTSAVDTICQRHAAQPPLVSLLCLFLLTISATVCPSLAQMPPFPMPSVPSSLPLLAANNAFVPITDDVTPLAAIVDAQPVEVVPAELTVDGATDDDQSTTNALSIDVDSSKMVKAAPVPLLPPSAVAAARAWTKRLQYASVGGGAAMHLASPSGAVPLMMMSPPTAAFRNGADSGTERRRKPPIIAAPGDVQQKKRKHPAKQTDEAADDESDTSEAVGTARLVAAEDVDRDQLGPAAAVPLTASTSPAVSGEQQLASTATTDRSPTDEDERLTVSASSASSFPLSSTASPVSTENGDADAADDGPPPPPPISVAAGQLDNNQLPLLPLPLLSSSSDGPTPAVPSPLPPLPSDNFSTQSANGGDGAAELQTATVVPHSSFPSVGTTVASATTAATATDNLGDNSSAAMAHLSSDGDKMAASLASRVAPSQQSPTGAADGDRTEAAPPPAKNTQAVGELDLKSDRELAKLMRRTTIRMRDYPTEMPNTPTATTTANPLVVAAQLAASQAPSLFPGALPGGGGPFALPPPQPLQSHPTASAAQSARAKQQNHHPQQQQQQRRHSPPRAEQFEQLGCGWDLMTQSCKDVFRVGWCESCGDFGASPFVHDCRCTAVTGLYVQTASFLGSAAAAARANAALSANQTAATGSGTVAAAVPPPVIWPMLPLLPTLAQLGPPLEAPGGANAGTALPRAATAELQQQLLLANALHFPPHPVPTIGPAVPTAGGGGGGGGAVGLGIIPLGTATAGTQMAAQLAAVPSETAAAAQQQQQQLIRQQQQQWDMMTPILLASPTHLRTDTSAHSGALFSPQLSAAQFSFLKRKR